MRGRPAGAIVTLTLRKQHWPEPRPIAGEFLVTDAGSGYLVMVANGDRYTCVKVEPDKIPGDATTHEMHWLPRGRRR